ncbi:trypsin-like serine protease [Nostoc sp. LPT]|uniref:trypsin-like serine protease n=1 Tax=Nostoc sp. LPT TaxID=2815387 RepID=UPI001DB699FC|nr:trypsin-like serine protease [Nostoc sp. LPT]MBN4001280.1 trypsin-like serine protease [Nostoc sp. LPT]
MKKLKLLTLASTLISTVGAFTAVNIGKQAEAIVVTGNPNDYIVPRGIGDGIVELRLNQNGNALLCTGSLLPTGLHILTAAHCLTENKIPGTIDVENVRVNFNLLTGRNSVESSTYYIHPGWNGDVSYANDIAIIGLDTLAPIEADRYNIYRGGDELDQNFTVVGYGLSGNGKTGSDPINFPGGIKRYGRNTYDYDSYLRNREANAFKVLGYDFDSGLERNNNPPGDTGLGIDEVISAPGDSGGPALINGLITGIASFDTRFNQGRADVNDRIDFSFGEISYNTRVSYYANFIDDVLAGKIAATRTVPEPSTVLGTVFTLSALTISSHFKKKVKQKL